LCNSANTQRDTILHITNSWWSVQNACCWWRIFLIGKWSINNLNVSRSWCKNAKSDLFITGKCQTAIVQFTYRKVILRVTRPITVLIGRLHLRRYNLISLFTVNKQYNEYNELLLWTIFAPCEVFLYVFSLFVLIALFSALFCIIFCVHK